MQFHSAIGLPKKIRALWLDVALDLVANGVPFADGKSGLMELIQHNTPGKEAISKALRSLRRIWFDPPQSCVAARDTALELYRRAEPKQRMVFHWGMALICYPFLAAVAEHTGRLLREIGRLRRVDVIRSLGERCGRHEYKQRVVRFNLSSFLDWGLLSRGREHGEYIATIPIAVEEPAQARWLLGLDLQLEAPTGILANLEAPAALFPFALKAAARD